MVRMEPKALLILFCLSTVINGVITGDGEQTGQDLVDGWSEWSEWSSCSRSCGGGVAVQSRRCLNWQGCKGNSVRYNLCEDVPCPETAVDFLALQCSEHDNAFLDGDRQKWEPAEGGESCVLTCKVKGTDGPPVVLSPRVMDGTRCGKNSEGVCVHGQCQTLGCDRILGSKQTVDVCGVCGGNGESCGANSVRWRRKIDKACSATCGGGYRVISARCENMTTGEAVSAILCRSIPRPASIVSTCGESPCPASWETGQWTPCSASCGLGYQLREVFCAENKTSSLTRIADHSCTDPRPDHRRTCGGDCPRWLQGVWSKCSVTCGDGVQRRVVSCRKEDGESSDLCDYSIRPNSTRPCRTGLKCSYIPPSRQLVLPRWLSDSMEEPGNSLHPFDGDSQMDEERVPSEPTFIAGRWSDCSATCGEGTRTRNVTCKIYLEFSQSMPVLPDAQCQGRKRPVEAKRCFLRSCPPFESSNDFINHSQGDKPDQPTIPFSSFEDPESSGILRSKGVLPPSKLQSMEDPFIFADDSQPLDSRSPNSEESMDKIFYPLIQHGLTPISGYAHNNEVIQTSKFVWREDGYTSCSRSCLGGVQEQRFFCMDAKEGSRVSPQMCDARKRPDSITKTCNDRPCPPRWDVSDFGKCSKSCGGGITRRRVVCLHEMTRSGSGKMAVSNSLCPQPPPYAQKYCNMEHCPARWVTGKWSRCSRDCKGGYRTRTIRCVQKMVLGELPSKKTADVPADKCPKIKPPTKRRCFRKSCSKKKFRRNKSGPSIRAQVGQNYRQKKYMKTVVLKIGGKASVFHGAKIKIKCPTRRYDRRNISWWRNGALLGPAGKKMGRIRVTKKGVLKIHRIEYTDAGIYFCKAGPQEANLTLQVQPLPASFASSEENLKPATRMNDHNKPKIGTNDIYIHGFEERPQLTGFRESDLKLNLFPFSANRSYEHPLRTSADVMATSGPSGQHPLKFNLHTMEESSSEAPLRSFIYGKVSQNGVPAGLLEPDRGIGLLSRKVAISRAKDKLKDGEALYLPEVQPRGPEEQVFGVLQNLTQNAQINSEEKFHFATIRGLDNKHELPHKSEAGDGADGSLRHDSSTTSREHKERSTNPTFSETDSDLVPADKTISGEALRRFLPPATMFPGPHNLGKGNRESLEFEWVVSNWTECSQTCSFTGSSRGHQHRSVICVLSVNGVRNTVENSLCQDAGLAVPLNYQKCGFQECPQWRVGDWSACENSRCYTLHSALQKREVKCALFNGSSASEGLCDEITKPRHKRECFNRQCVGVWRTLEWSNCTAPCGGQGYRTRVLQCVWNGTKKSAGNACREKPRPEVVRWCDGPPCPKKATKSSSSSHSAGSTRKEDENCQDQSRYCKIAVRINMCKHYQRRCCKSCQPIPPMHLLPETQAEMPEPPKRNLRACQLEIYLSKSSPSLTPFYYCNHGTRQTLFYFFIYIFGYFSLSS